MNILVVGAGGREHAICWAIRKSTKCKNLYCAPGNAGIGEVATCVNIGITDTEKIVTFSLEKNIDLVVIGPEDALVIGLVDELRKNSILAFGPNKSASILEGSKSFMKEFFDKYNIPTAEFKCFDNHQDAISYVKHMGAPIVVKASGLAAGKGVFVCQNEDDAVAAIKNLMLNDALGEAGKKVVIEELLLGEEVSFFCLVSNNDCIPLATAQDHKRAYDGDLGPNTGGMGAYSPANILNDSLSEKIMRTIIKPTIEGMSLEKRPFSGLLYAGLMITENGPKVLEYNVRFGDPECQVILTRIASDPLEMFLATAQGRLSEINLEWKKDSSLVIIMATNGYPGEYQRGSVILGLEKVEEMIDVNVFHSGTANRNGNIIANGGRVLGITATGKSLKEAQRIAYSGVKKIGWENGFYRTDIGNKGL